MMTFPREPKINFPKTSTNIEYSATRLPEPSATLSISHLEERETHRKS